MKLGILGAGQLAQMLAEAAQQLNVECVVLDPTPNSPATRFAKQICAPYDDADALRDLASQVDVATYEFENVPDVAAQTLASKIPLRPLPVALSTSQDRLNEKTMFRSLQIPTAPFAAVDSAAGLARAIDEIGLPAVLKTRRMGYDGKGQMVLRTAADANGAFERLGGVPCILEGFIRFEREVSLVCVRARNGETKYYPLTQTIHEGGILRMTVSPAPRVSDALAKAAREYGERVLNHLYYVGTLALELFESNGTLLANEIAPRVHNSGHWTIEGARTSQFANHVRAVMDFPLGDIEPVRPTVMLNILGDAPPSAEVDAVRGACMHLYGKSPARLRKIGHITLVDDGDGTFEERVEKLRVLVAKHGIA